VGNSMTMEAEDGTDSCKRHNAKMEQILTQLLAKMETIQEKLDAGQEKMNA
jgi:hypothetical protein